MRELKKIFIKFFKRLTLIIQVSCIDNVRIVYLMTFMYHTTITHLSNYILILSIVWVFNLLNYNKYIL